jgi:nucleoid DNA-binding protein
METARVVVAQQHSPTDDVKKETIMTENQTPPAKKPLNKTEIIAHLSEVAGITKQQVAGLLDALAKLIEKNLDEHGPGVFVIPSLLQIKVVRKPAVEAHMGINPFTKQEMMISAKPAQNTIKLVALKGLKEMVVKKPE